MFDRAIRSEFVDKLLSAGTLLSLCAVITLGPRPQRVALETQATIETAGRTPNVNSLIIDASETIRHTSAENQNP